MNTPRRRNITAVRPSEGADDPRARALAYALDLARYRARALDRARDRAFDFARAFDFDFARARASLLDLDRASAFNLVTNLDLVTHRVCDLADDLASASDREVASTDALDRVASTAAPATSPTRSASPATAPATSPTRSAASAPLKDSLGWVGLRPRQPVCWLPPPGCCQRPIVPDTPRSTSRNCGRSHMPGSPAVGSCTTPLGRSYRPCTCVWSCWPHGGGRRRHEGRAEGHARPHR